MKNLMFVLTFFSLWLSTRLNTQTQDFLAYGFILTFGVLHGSNDINVLLRLSKFGSNSKTLIFRYVLAVLVVVSIFFVSKLLALLFFILISGYHFGEQHLKSYFKGPSRIGTLLFSHYGLTILFLIFYLKSTEVVPIFLDITGKSFGVYIFEYTFLILVLGLPIAFGLSIWKGLLKINLVKELFLLGVFYVVFLTSSLLWAFAIYFIVWHSVPSMYDQMVFLYGNSSKDSFFKYLKSSWIYWLGSILGLVLLYLFIGKNTNYFITVILYILAAITFPHVLVMSKIDSTETIP